MSRLLRPCLTCGTPSAGSRCPAHQPVGWTVRPARPSPRGTYGGNWPSIRAAVLKAEPACRRCGAARATQVDHVIAVQDGGTNDASNLQPLCAACHRSKSATDAHARKAAGRGGRDRREDEATKHLPVRRSPHVRGFET